MNKYSYILAVLSVIGLRTTACGGRNTESNVEAPGDENREKTSCWMQALIAPGIPDAVQYELMEKLVSTYGKTIHTVAHGPAADPPRRRADDHDGIYRRRADPSAARGRTGQALPSRSLVFSTNKNTYEQNEQNK